MNRLLLLILLPIIAFLSPSTVSSSAKNAPARSLSTAHPKIGESATFGNDKVKIELVGKLQNFAGGTNPPRDEDIVSPKSVNIHPSGKKFYVNSLEGGKTVVYSLPDFKKLTVISHKFDDKDASLWAPESGLFKFRHYTDNLGTFMGKPVESTFSHNGRYLWVPYYRRSFDLNAQDPSAVAIIDTSTDKIIRIMEAGVLPKMIALSPDGKTIAITHWGDNTVGLIDVASANPKEWKYLANIPVGRQLFHNFSLTSPVDRDSNTGEALRGTVFTPDGRYLLVGCMSGGGIAVIDVNNRKYLGKIVGTRPNLRHLVIRGNKLYASINASGYVQRIGLDKVLEAIGRLDGSGNVTLHGWEECKVSGGARTLELSPKGDYIFVACNSGSALCVVDSTMHLVATLSADSFPVGLDISPDGKWLMTTSQGRRQLGGGNCVDIFSLTGLESDFDASAVEAAAAPADSLANVHADADSEDAADSKASSSTRSLILIFSLLGISGFILFVLLRRKRRF